MRIKTLIGAGTLVLAFGALAVTPALASVDVLATLIKDKDITVILNITKTKTVTILAEGDFTLPGAAEAEAIVNVANTDNTVDDAVDGTSVAFGIEKDAHMVGSVKRNRGITQVNQDVGNMVNQANVLSVAVTESANSVANSEAWVEQLNTRNDTRQEESLQTQEGSEPGQPSVNGFDTDRTSVMRRSVTGNIGITSVNQNSGNMNNQTNAFALAVGFGANVALSEGVLGQENTDNVMDEIETVKLDRIADWSVHGNIGVTNVNQSTGNMNNQSAVMSVATTLSNATIPTAPPALTP